MDNHPGRVVERLRGCVYLGATHAVVGKSTLPITPGIRERTSGANDGLCHEYANLFKDLLAASQSLICSYTKGQSSTITRPARALSKAPPQSPWSSSGSGEIEDTIGARTTGSKDFRSPHATSRKDMPSITSHPSNLSAPMHPDTGLVWFSEFTRTTNLTTTASLSSGHDNAAAT